jgi:hypothetical protein
MQAASHGTAFKMPVFPAVQTGLTKVADETRV